jgi:hypothetical protein
MGRTDGVPVLAVCLLRFNNRNPKLCGLFEEGTKQRLITAIRVFSNSKSLTAAIHFWLLFTLTLLITDEI